ncbi:PH domain-containing protein [Brevibacterium atlanticum]|uniref:PH domain-containing protein n=1 Tax=Brevibacterium atlanticum TaxID=2697563 RepID=UPI0014221204|nr:PH domain-containing protein [Brevibacterium atlanticum]
MATLFDPRVDEHLISTEGERVIDEVRRHPLAFFIPTAIIVLGVAVMSASTVVALQFAWIPVVIGAAIVLFGTYRFLTVHMDRFVITNMRVFRIHGIFTQHKATMPMSRILDISVHKPLMGRVFRYGHFVFESAAQDQGLRDIRFVGRPNERDLTIQRVIQRSGLRSAFSPFDSDEYDDAQSATEDYAIATDETDSRSEVITDVDSDISAGESHQWKTMELETPRPSEASEEIVIHESTPDDPISEAAQAWDLRWPERTRMEAVTTLMDTQRRLTAELDELLRPLGLNYSRFEVLLMLFLDAQGAIPLVELFTRLQGTAPSASSSVTWLEDASMVKRVVYPEDNEMVFVAITSKGRTAADRASRSLADARFGFSALSERESRQLRVLLARYRENTIGI